MNQDGHSDDGHVGRKEYPSPLRINELGTVGTDTPPRYVGRRRRASKTWKDILLVTGTDVDVDADMGVDLVVDLVVVVIFTFFFVYRRWENDPLILSCVHQIYHCAPIIVL